jgi:sulfatase modifying factor 1
VLKPSSIRDNKTVAPYFQFIRPAALRLLVVLFGALVLFSLVAGCKPSAPKLEAEIAQIRRLAISGDIEKLANTLDGSMVLIPAGEFSMGSMSGHDDEQPQRQVYLDGFQIDRFEVTNAQYRRFALATGARTPQNWYGLDIPPGQDDLPVIGVSWEEASAYCDWVSKRLPSEAEWEKACGGPAGFVYPWGNEWEAGLANTGLDQSSQWPDTVEDIWLLLDPAAVGTGYPQPQPVGSYPQGASAYGALDMSGNAAEWVFDWYNWQGYQNLPERNPVGSAPPWNHSVRGSSWVDRDGEQDLVQDLSRCAKRNSSHTANDPRLGFRCARSLE